MIHSPFEGEGYDHMDVVDRAKQGVRVENGGAYGTAVTFHKYI
jgi:hypothetical protein